MKINFYLGVSNEDSRGILRDFAKRNENGRVGLAIRLAEYGDGPPGDGEEFGESARRHPRRQQAPREEPQPADGAAPEDSDGAASPPPGASHRGVGTHRRPARILREPLVRPARPRGLPQRFRRYFRR
ncbi:hypothetical protein GE061_019895 [Apolygus lucorum]|uniref:Uncharacterized protein n=1 Tax=Apolygus lucorum TaxID=248454 RepID=A0A6A4JW74_APOLU|nr:hypothetical protein GE061_019895 [Apolygus lucorum]